MYRGTGQTLEVLLVHPGGPFWRNRDDGAWSIPKGEIEAGEDPEDVAQAGVHGGTRQRPGRTASAAGRDTPAQRQACSRVRR